MHITSERPASFKGNDHQSNIVNVLAIPTVCSHQEWHDKVRGSQEILEYLLTGYTSTHCQLTLDSLKQATVLYLRETCRWQTSPSPERDVVLTSLIDYHGYNYPETKSLAVIACLEALSPEKSSRFLRSLVDENLSSYLRCLTLAGPIIPESELIIAKNIVLILSEQSEIFAKFQFLIESIAVSSTFVFTSPNVIDAALEEAKIGPKLQANIESQLEEGRLWTVFRSVRWLKTAPDMLCDTMVTAILDKYLKAWRSYLVWRPNEARLRRWESRNMTDNHKMKVLPLIKLDGPGVLAARHYDHVKLQPNDADQLERFLDLLSQSHSQGINSLELFIFMCIDAAADEMSLAAIGKALGRGDHGCLEILTILRVLDQRSGLLRRMEDLITIFSLPSAQQALQTLHVGIERIAEIAESTLSWAQKTFCKQLDTLVPERLGELIHCLCDAISRETWVHSSLAPSTLAIIRQMPSIEVLANLFQQLEDSDRTSDEMCHYIKLLLRQSFGGLSDGGSIDMLHRTRFEKQFWDRRPNNLKRDLAKMIQTMKGVDHRLYTSCLEGIIDEDNLLLEQLKPGITDQSAESCVAFVRYLAHRRSLGQLQHDCWLQLAESLIKRQGPTMLPEMADSLAAEDWMEMIGNISNILAPVLSQTARSDGGLSQDSVTWWKRLEDYREAIGYLQTHFGPDAGLRWLYFPSTKTQILELLDLSQSMKAASPTKRELFARLLPNGTNTRLVCDTTQAFSLTSSLGRAVFERILSRTKKNEWTKADLGIIMELWRSSPLLDNSDRPALDLLRELFKIPRAVQVAKSRTARKNLEAEYATLMLRAQELETMRMNLRRHDPTRAMALLQKFRMLDDVRGRAAGSDIPSDLLDAVEIVGDGEYELAFALTKMSDMHRKARGVPDLARMLIVRVQMWPTVRFCVHVSPRDDSISRHRMLTVRSGAAPDSAICSVRPSLFSYYVGRQLHHHLSSGRSTLSSIHALVQGLIAKAPASCLICCTSMQTKSWKPFACSAGCSLSLRRAPLEVRLHNLLIDSLAIDLLLTTIFSAIGDNQHSQLLAGCPVQFARLQTVINSIPNLSSLQTADDLRTAVCGIDQFAKEREALLSWMCLSFRGLILSAPAGFVVPSMPGAIQFVMPNNNHEREEAFNAQAGARNSSGVVFHGTPIARLWPILTGGLKVMSDTNLMIHGASHGAGVYCGEEPSMSLNGYSSTSTGQSWANSSLRNLKALLGCQLAGYTAASQGYHVVSDANRLVVRHLFLVPVHFQCPIRAHVVGAMTTANAAFRTGLR
ncbi:hypothetical protein BJ170DRAFT_581465 [Xylariales sp. AK1849]|nr:hypothetical protein BJ170DRAFT_581465 [Xylariales sp. AK1849]